MFFIWYIFAAATNEACNCCSQKPVFAWPNRFSNICAQKFPKIFPAVPSPQSHPEQREQTISPRFNEIRVSFNKNNNRIPPQHLWRMTFSSYTYMVFITHWSGSLTSHSIKHLCLCPLCPLHFIFSFLLWIVLSASSAQDKSHGCQNFKYDG